VISTLWLLGSRTWQAFGRANCTQMAAAISYYVLFAIVPLTIFAVSVLGMVANEEMQERVTEEITDRLNAGVRDVVIELSEDGRERVAAQYGSGGLNEIEASLDVLSESEGTELAAAIDDGEEVTIAGRTIDAEDFTVRTDSVIADVINDVISVSPALSIFSLVTTALAAAVMFGALRRSLNVVWGAVPRPFAQQRLIEIGMLVGALLFLLLSVASTAAIQTLRESSDASPNPLVLPDGFLWAAIGYVVPWVLSFALFLVLFLTVPNTRTSVRDVWPGALLAATLFELLKYGYSVYVANFSNYGAVYGALGGILLFMLFTYLASYFLLMGAELAVQHTEWRAGRIPDEAPAAEGERSLWQLAVSGVRSLFVSKKG
jgi:YihY family inner membrane protein